MTKIVIAACTLLALADIVSAETVTARMTVIANTEPTLELTIEAAGAAVSGTSTNAVVSDLGSFSKNASAPPGFSITQTSSSYTLHSSIEILVNKFNLTSSDYTLTARLQNAPPSGVTWKVHNVALVEGSETTITTVGAYGAVEQHSWAIVVDDATDPQTVDNTIHFTAVSN